MRNFDVGVMQKMATDIDPLHLLSVLGGGLLGSGTAMKLGGGTPRNLLGGGMIGIGAGNLINSLANPRPDANTGANLGASIGGMIGGAGTLMAPSALGLPLSLGGVLLGRTLGGLLS